MVGNSIIRPVIAKLARFRSDPIGSCLHLSSANVSIWAKEHLTTEKEPRAVSPVTAVWSLEARRYFKTISDLIRIGKQLEFFQS